MIARIRQAGKRLALGTGLLLHDLDDALAPGGWGPLLVRCGGTLLGLAFLGRLLARAPHLAYAIPLVWVLAAWRVSDSSATPPQEAAAPLGDELAGETGEIARVVYSANGVMCTIHPVRGEANEP